MLPVMKLAVLGLTALLVASPHSAPETAAADDGAPFVASDQLFANPAACVAHLAAFVAKSAPPAFSAAAGPYRIAADDMRAHRVRAQDWGHEIEELRCLNAALSARKWTHSMSDVKPFTMEDIKGMNFPES